MTSATGASPRRGVRAVVLAALVSLVAAGCGYSDTPLPEPSAAASSSAPPAATVQCDNATQSYAPDATGGASVRKIKQRKRLIAGVSADSLLLGANDPLDNRIKGFDIDVAQAIADALGVRLQLRVISAADRIPLLQQGAIDIVARNFTMNCARWQQVAFSAVYYSAAQKVLVRRDDEASFTGAGSLRGKKVCAPRGSTSLDNILRLLPGAEPVAAANHAGCLILFQRGDADAITGDDTVLAGLAAQDRYAVVPEQKALTREPYGIGMNKDDVDLVRFVNAVLERRDADGRWQRSYDRWLRPALSGVDARPPTPEYGR